MGVIKKNFGELMTSRKDGALIGPWNAWLHFPQFGKPAWALNKAMQEHSTLPAERSARPISAATSTSPTTWRPR
jgi:hypothetical protein